MVLLGCWIFRKHRIQLSLIKVLAISTFFITLSICEVLFVSGNHLAIEYSYGFFTFLFPAFVAYRLNFVSQNIKACSFGCLCDKYTMGLYYIHPLVIMLLVELVPSSIESLKGWGMLRFISTLVGSFIILIVMKFIFKKTKLKKIV